MVNQGKNIFLTHTSIFFLLISLPFFAGCGTTKQSKFYTLSSLKMEDTGQKAITSDSKISIGIGPVNLPYYLARPQMVSRTSQHEVFVDEFNRWADDLGNDITRVLSENLLLLLSSEHIAFFPLEQAAVIEYKIMLNVTRFDVMPDDTFQLKTQWGILEKDGKKLIVRETSLSESIDGKDAGARVAAMSRSLEKLSSEIAEGIKAVLKKE